MRITFSITNRCDKACAHCGLSSSPSETGELTNDEIKKCIDQLVSLPPGSVELSRARRPEIRFSGGEPFLRFDDMLEISRYAVDRGVSRVGCTTNAGWATTPETARQKLEAFRKAGLQDLRLSCDHFHDFVRHLDNIRNAFTAAVELAVPVGIKVVVHKESQRASDILRALEDRTRDILFFVEELSLMPVGRAQNLPEHIFLRHPGIPSEPCDLLGTLLLDSNRDLYPCCVPGWPWLLHAGNTGSESLTELIRKIDANPLFKIIQRKGPAYFVPFLQDTELDIKPGSFVNRCHLCQTILNEAGQNETVMKGLNEAITTWEKEQEVLRSTLEVVENLLG